MAPVHAEKSEKQHKITIRRRAQTQIFEKGKKGLEEKNRYVGGGGVHERRDSCPVQRRGKKQSWGRVPRKFGEGGLIPQKKRKKKKEKTKAWSLI